VEPVQVTAVPLLQGSEHCEELVSGLEIVPSIAACVEYCDKPVKTERYNFFRSLGTMFYEPCIRIPGDFFGYPGSKKHRCQEPLQYLIVPA